MAETMVNAPAEGMLAERFSISDVQFEIIKLNAMEGWRVLEYIRPELGNLKLSPNGAAGMLAQFLPETAPAGVPAGLMEAGMQILQAVLALEPAFVDRIRQDVFRSVRYLRPESKNNAYEYLLGKEDDAFAGMPPIAVYKVLVRAVAVNFFDSLGDILSPMDGADQT